MWTQCKLLFCPYFSFRTWPVGKHKAIFRSPPSILPSEAKCQRNNWTMEVSNFIDPDAPPWSLCFLNMAELLLAYSRPGLSRDKHNEGLAKGRERTRNGKGQNSREWFAMTAGGAGQCLCVREKGGEQFAVFQKNRSALAGPVMTGQLPPVHTVHLPQANGSGYRSQLLKNQVLPASSFFPRSPEGWHPQWGSENPSGSSSDTDTDFCMGEWKVTK